MINPSYLAGVIDSDGSISISKRNIHRPRASYQGLLQITWTCNPASEEFFNQLVNQYGGSYFWSDKKSKGRFKNAKPIIKYMITTNKLTPLLKDIYPFLRLKRSQAVNAIRLDHINKYCMQFGFGRSKPQRIEDIQERLYLRNRERNSKNGS